MCVCGGYSQYPRAFAKVGLRSMGRMGQDGRLRSMGRMGVCVASMGQDQLVDVQLIRSEG